MLFGKKRKQDQQPDSIWSKFVKISLLDSEYSEVGKELRIGVSGWFRDTRKALSSLSKADFETLASEGVNVDLIKLAYENSSVVVNKRLEQNECSPVPLDQTLIGPLLLEKLEEAGVPHRAASYQINSEGYPESFSELYGEDQESWPSPQRLEVLFALSSGRLLLTEIEFYKDEEGEFAYWYTDLLVSNLPMKINNRKGEDWLDADSYKPWLLAERLQIPTSLSNLALLAENRLIFADGNGLVNFPRSYFFSAEGSGQTHDPAKLVELIESENSGEDDLHRGLPAPGFSILTNNRFKTSGYDSEGAYREAEFVAPNSIRFGWTLDSLAVVSRTDIRSFQAMFSRVGDCIDEGYSMFRGAFLDDEGLANPYIADYHFAFFRGEESVLGPKGAEVTVGNLDGCQTWVPQSYAYELFQNSWDALDLKESKTETQKAMMEGLGTALPHLISNFVFGVLIPSLTTKSGDFKLSANHKSTLEYIERLCGAALLLPVPSQQSNALSNSGVAHYQVGDLDTAEQRLLLALEHAAGNQHVYVNVSEAEACYILGLLATERGNLSQADDYFQRAEKSGGYDVQAWLRTPHFRGASKTGESGKASKPVNDAKTNSSAPGPSSAAKRFCTNCGGAFEKDEYRFCAGCGQKRES